MSCIVELTPLLAHGGGPPRCVQLLKCEARAPCVWRAKTVCDSRSVPLPTLTNGTLLQLQVRLHEDQHPRVPRQGREAIAVGYVHGHPGT